MRKQLVSLQDVVIYSMYAMMMSVVMMMMLGQKMRRTGETEREKDAHFSM